MAKRTKKPRKVRRAQATRIEPLPPAQAASVSAAFAAIEVLQVQAASREEPEVPAQAALVEPAPEPADLVPLDDVDEAFFKQGDDIESTLPPEESIPPIADDTKTVSIPPPPEVLARRSKFRKLVGAVVVLGALVVLGGWGKTIASESPAPSASIIDAVKTVSAAQPRKAAEPPKSETLPTASAPAAQVAMTAHAPRDPAEGVAAPPACTDCRKEALALLNRGKMTDAIAMARAAIRQDPSHALGYLYLGTALQETGKHKEAIAAYSDCVRNAKLGPVWECRAMGGRE